MKECCENCVYRHQLKQLVNGEWQYSDCCIALTRQVDIRDDYDSFVLIVRPNDMCELFRGRHE